MSFAVLGFDKMPAWIILVITFSAATAVALLVHFIMAPQLKKRILGEVLFSPANMDWFNKIEFSYFIISPVHTILLLKTWTTIV